MPLIPNHPQIVCLRPETWTETIELEKVFQRPPPINLEVDLGCGKGRFLLTRAAAHKEICFLGIDKRRMRILKVERAAFRQKLENIRLLCSEISLAVENFIPDGSVSVYYLFFPDPWPKRRHHRRRLFDAHFINAVHRTLRDGGLIHAATDHMDYFSIINDSLSADRRFVETEPFIPVENESTNFELVFMAQNKPIGRCSFMKTSP